MDLPDMQLISATPSQASSEGNISLTLQVNNLGTNPQATIAGRPTVIEKITPEGQLVVTVPAAPGVYGLVPVVVTDDQGRSARADHLFSYYAAHVGFKQHQTIDVGVQPVNIASGDLNGDHITDLVVANASYESTSSNPSLSILIGNADGTFRSTANLVLPLTPNYPSGLSLADFDGDGKLDLAFTVYDKTGGGKGKLGLLLGHGNGTFQTTPAHSLEVGIHPYCLSSKDLDNDGKRELVVVNSGPSNGSAPGSVAVIAFQQGTLQLLQEIDAGTLPFFVTAADFDGDGKLDLAVPSTATNKVRLYQNQTPPGMPLSFQTSGFTELSIGSNPTSMVVADFNQDGLPDIATANYTTHDVTVLLNMGNGQFDPNQHNFLVGAAGTQRPYDLTVADINGDRIPDLLTANSLGSSFGFLQGSNSTDLFLPTQTFSTPSGPRAIATGDLNNDKKTDVIVASYYSNSISVFLNQSW